MISKIQRLSGNMVSPLTKVKCGIVHLGIGAFHRAHQAWYTHQAMQLSGGDWRITGVSLRNAGVAEQLNPQNGLYTLIEQDADGYQPTVITAISHVLVAPQNPQAVLKALQHEHTRIVSLTITEKGYCHDPSTGKLNIEHPDIKHDLANAEAPKSALGYLVRAMQYRIEHHISPFSVMSCDNLPSNGQLLRGLILDFARLINTELADAIACQYRFPSSMVDRIVPAVTEDVRQQFCDKLEYDDHALVATERFSQWVIEDDFVAGRPAWDEVGALMVDDVHNFETMKLRLLNGSHSSIAYLGCLSKLDTVAEAINLPEVKAFIHALMQHELKPSVSVPDDIDLDHYCLQLLNRFANPNLRHQTYQIAMDGSQKLPQRLLKPLQFQRQSGGCIQRICFVIALWIQYVSGKDLETQSITVQDPLAESLAALFREHSHDVDAWVHAVFNLNAVFDGSLADDNVIIDNVIYWLCKLRQKTTAIALLNEVTERADKC